MRGPAAVARVQASNCRQIDLACEPTMPVHVQSDIPMLPHKVQPSSDSLGKMYRTCRSATDATLWQRSAAPALRSAAVGRRGGATQCGSDFLWQAYDMPRRSVHLPALCACVQGSSSSSS